MGRTKIEPAGKRVRLAEVPMKAVDSKTVYEKRLKQLQVRMLRVQQAYFHEKRRAVLVFEGWDASGKGGAIRRLTAELDPRGCKVWPIAAPRPEEQGRHYLWRFWQRLPEPGTIAVFDRSWYGRLLVERVEGFAKPKEWKRAFDEINEFERLLTDDGVRFVKIFLHISKDEQLRRFMERMRNPTKRWKLTEEDIRNRDRWEDYEAAIEDIFKHTSTAYAPWHVIGANHKWHTRLSVLETVVDALAKGVSLEPPSLDPALHAAALERLGIAVEEEERREKAKKAKKAAE